MKKNGFIATSLIYSFFLIFITLFLSVIADYLQNKVFLNEIEKGIKNDINDSMGIRDFEVGDIITDSNTLTPDSNTWIIGKIEIDNNMPNNNSIYLYSYETFDSITEDDSTKVLTSEILKEDLHYNGVYNNTYLNKLSFVFNGEYFTLDEFKVEKNSNCLTIEKDDLINNCSYYDNNVDEPKYRIRKKIIIGNNKYQKEISPDGSITITGVAS